MVAIESPGPIPVVIWRICDATGIGRVGKKIQQAIEQAVELTVSEGKIAHRDRFLWTIEQSEMEARNRELLPSRERNLELICSQELEVAITSVYGQPSEVSNLSSAAKRICRLLGFSRVSSEMEEQIGQRIQQLQTPSN